MFHVVSLNIEQDLLLDPTANVFAFGNFNFDREDWSTHPGRSNVSIVYWMIDTYNYFVFSFISVIHLLLLHCLSYFFLSVIVF